MIGIVDCNSFYCSCERVFRPDLQHRPVAVLSNNDGCVISVSDELKALNIPVGIPYFEIKPLVAKHNIAVFSSNYTLYGDMSRRVMHLLQSIIPRIEVYSVDEAFIDLSDVPLSQLEATVQNIRATIWQCTGIPVSIGISATKTLAKVANYAAKKNKQVTECIKIAATREEQIILLKSIRIGNIWGIGRSYAQFLVNQGITNGWELANMPEQWIRHHLGGVIGIRLQQELQGIPAIPFEQPLTIKQMIGTSRMFRAAVTTLPPLQEAVASYISRAAEKLRRQHCVTDTITVSLSPKIPRENGRYSRGSSMKATIQIPLATQSTHTLIKAAVPLVEKLYRSDTAYIKASVLLSNLTSSSAIQANMFKASPESKERPLMLAIDNINASIRAQTVRFATAGTQQAWSMKQDLKSPYYTTRLSDIRVVK